MLILASDDQEHFINSQKLWSKYMHNNENIQSFFYKCDPNLDSDIYYDDNLKTIYVKHIENYMPGILYKTIKTFHYIYKNYDFDYIYRTNMSSVIDLDKMYNYILNNKIDYGGVIGNYHNVKYASGCGFLLSKNACIKLLMQNAKIPYHIIDDVAIGYILTQLVNLTEIPRGHIDSLNSDEFKKEYITYDKNYFHFRCKSENNNNETVEIQKKLLKNIYPDLNFTTN